MSSGSWRSSIVASCIRVARPRIWRRRWSRCSSTKRNGADARWKARRATPISRSDCIPLRKIRWSGKRFNIRRVDEGDPLREADRTAAQAARQRAAFQASDQPRRSQEQKPWTRLERALRATDQVLQSGGLRVVVLDLASVPAEQALRIPSATWWRFQEAAQMGDAILLLLTREPCARSIAACVLECVSETEPVVQGVLAAMTRSAQISRQRSGPVFGKKAPGRVASWNANPLWMQAAGR